MCGISGIVCKQKEENLFPSLTVLTNAMRHRGPDDEGYMVVNTEQKCATLGGEDTPSAIWESAFMYTPKTRITQENGVYWLGLGHRRLSVIDTSAAGHQPMCSENQEVWIVFNGEIYNYIELREELRKQGHSFVTHSDTEVILQGYLAWGKDCVHHFNGMWSFVIYDKRKQLLFGSRDRFGVKPFYYYANGTYFCFASEIKALTTLPFVDKSLNQSAIFDYLAMGQIEMPDSPFFSHIKELEGGHSFSYCLNRHELDIWRYYSLVTNTEKEAYNPTSSALYIEQTKALLEQSIKLRTRSDVPIGSCLSGGIDSSGIVCFMHEFLKKENSSVMGHQPKVFTASYANSPADESFWAQQIVDHTNASWHQTFPKAQELISDLEDIVYTLDLPFWSTSTYAQYRVMKLASEQGVKVLLDGQGGDEIFAGYPAHWVAYWTELLYQGKWNTLWYELNKTDNAGFYKTHFLTTLAKHHLYKNTPAFIKSFLLRAKIKENTYITDDFWQQHTPRLDRLEERIQPLNSVLDDFTTGNFLKRILRCEDRTSMRFSVESRTPFADDTPLIEHLFAIPSVYKIKDGLSKYVLRESLNGVVPNTVRLRRDKKGFETPEYEWMQLMHKELLAYISDEMSPYINTQALKKDWQDLIVNPTSKTTNRLWRFINLSIWMKINKLH